MSKRLAPSVAAVALLLGLAACADPDDAGSSDTSPTPSATTSAAPSSTPSTAPTAAADDLVGTWRSDEADWTVHFKADGTFSEDFEGNPDFRTGTYRVEGSTVTLEGGDGESSEGTRDGDSIAFRLGTLERQ